MSRRIVFPAIVVAVALGLMWLERHPGAQGDRAPAGPRSLDGDDVDTREELAAPAPVADRNSPTVAMAEAQLAVAPPRASPPTSAPDARATWIVRGIVLDPEGAPVPGLVLVVLPDGTCVGAYDTLARAFARAGDGAARSGPDGRFVLDTDLRRGEVFASGPDWATLYAGRAEAWAAEEEVLVVVAAPMRQAGRVVDTSDVPVVGATLWTYDQEGTGLPGFPQPLVRCVRVGARWTTGVNGEFDLAGFTWIQGRRIDVDHERHVLTHFYPQGVARDDWLVVLDRRPVQPVGEVGLRSEPVLFGVVRHADGRPAAGAHVRLMDAEARADDDGRWEFERPGSASAMVALVAVAEGAGPAILRDPTTWSGGGERIGPIELTLTEKSLTLRGRVVDTRGTPLQGLEARVLDPTLVDDSSSPYVTLERGLALDAAWPMTDTEGRFVLHGLSDREYTVLALDPATSLAISARARPSDEELVLVVPEDALIEELEGVVLDQRGVPVRGVGVAVELPIERYEAPSRSTELSRTDPRTTTDAEGSFKLVRVPRRGIALQFTSESIRSKSVAAGEEGFGPGRLEVRVARSMLVRVDVRGRAPLPTSARFLDTSGGPVIVKLISRGSSMFDVPLRDGRSEVVSAPETAAVAVLRQNEVEVGRIVLALQPGDVNVVGDE